mmetsp:Transcript_44105/g.64820  ORF Transcript_44105/g.64820 Transcript_44105/m.64820 type:complete len:676 (+) Transcript_44105:42-2069(+)
MIETAPVSGKELQTQPKSPLQPADAEDPELTPRAVLGGILVGGILCFSNMYFGLQTGWVTMGSLQSALLGFGLFKVLEPYLAMPFSAKENVVLQTTAVAAATMPLAGGFVGIIPALRLLAADEEFLGSSSTNGPIDLSMSSMALFGWCIALGFFGVFMAPPLRRQTILREKLPFPSGTATAEIIRQLHGLPSENRKDDDDDNNDRSEVASGLVNETASLLPVAVPLSTAPAPAWRLLFLCFAISAVYTLLGNFVPILKNVPLGSYLGLPALTAWSWTLQPSPSYFGQGLIMGPKTAVSMLLGTIVGWGVLAPMAKAEGWATGPIGDVATGATGWLLWVALAIMLADSAVSLTMLAAKVVLQSITIRSKGSGDEQHVQEELDPAPPHQQITWNIWLPGLLLASLLCSAILSPMFHMPPIQPAIAVLFSLLVAVLAVRALGETDLNPVSGIGKVSQIFFAVLAPGNVVANLVAGAIAEAGAMGAGDMMQDLQCGHLLRASPRAQFKAQLIGTAASCFLVVVAWLLYSSAYEIPGPQFPAPTAFIWLDMAKVVNGGGHLATNVLPTAMGAAAIAALLPVMETVVIPESHKWMVPSAMATAIGMYVTPNWTLPRVAGGLANYAWHRWDRDGAERCMIVVASGFVLGEGLTSVVTAGLKSAGIDWVWCGGCPAGFCSGCP